MPTIKPAGKKMETGVKEDDVGRLINSLQNIERTLRTIEKKLGIEEAPLPVIDFSGTAQTEKDG